MNTTANSGCSTHFGQSTFASKDPTAAIATRGIASATVHAFSRFTA